MTNAIDVAMARITALWRKSAVTNPLVHRAAIDSCRRRGNDHAVQIEIAFLGLDCLDVTSRKIAAR